MIEQDETRSRGLIPTIAVDHVAYNVPDLEAAVSFFTNALGCRVLDRGGPVPRGNGLTLTYALVRYDPTLAFELLLWRGSGVKQAMPGFSDVGGGHLAFTVADLDVALAAAGRHPGVRVEPTDELPDGRRFARFTTPWGLTIQLLTGLPAASSA
jgi:catechol 2,3-dioxygenase-like lactoylglutathione lyase family enzyme